MVRASIALTIVRQPPMAAPSQLVGQALGHNCIIEQIGAGGMGVVYRAQDEQLERDVAIKVLPVGTLAGEAARKRFSRAIERLQQKIEQIKEEWKRGRMAGLAAQVQQ